jgi:carboxyl-terminal processing protease
MRRGDRIIRINEEATAGLTLEDVVARLQGEIGSRLDLYVERDGERGLQKIDAERARVFGRSIDSGPRILTTVAGGGAPSVKVGYLHLARLGPDAGGSVEDALRELARERVSGIVLDLRGNSGGLYAQAVRVANAFIKKGTLVSMVGVSLSRRKDEIASDDLTEPEVPLAVLVDHDTASGAEIVAAALRNLGRAIVLGQQTVGAGTVQVLFDVPLPLAQNEDGGSQRKLGLKLTTAQFLTGGDMPIQLRGVAPDIELRNVTVARVGHRIVFQMEPRRSKRSEEAYEWALAPSGGLVPPGHAAMTVDYLSTSPASDLPLAADRSGDEPVFGKRTTYSGDDFEATFAADLLAYVGLPGQAITNAPAAFAGLVKAREDARITAAAAALKTDWRLGPGTTAPRLSLKIEATGGGPVRAGNQVQVRGTVTNTGAVPAFRVRAVLTSDDPVFDGLEMPFGLVPPGEIRTFDLTVSVPRAAFARTDLVGARLRDDRGDVLLASAVTTTIDIEARPAPALSFTCRARVTAGRAGGGAHTLLTLIMEIRNHGKVPAEEAEATVRRVGDPAQDGVLVRTSRWSGAIAAGAKKEASFVVELPREPPGGPVELDLILGEGALQEPVRARMRVSPPRSPREGTAPNVSWEVTPPVVIAMPPLVTVNAPVVASGEFVHVTGEVIADSAARDVFIRVWNRRLKIPVRKVFYLNAAVAGARLPFEADVPLWAGSNIITVHARDKRGTQASRTVVVLKRTEGPAVAR